MVPWRALGLCAAGLAVVPAPASAAVGKPFTVTRSAEQFPNGFSADVNASGKTAFAWTKGRVVRFRIRSDAGKLSEVLSVSTSGRLPLGPTVALDGSGNALVVWHERTSPSTFRVYAATRPGGKRFGKPVGLGPSLFGAGALEEGSPIVDFDARGNALMAWRDQRGVSAAWAAPGGKFGSTQHLGVIKPLSIAFRGDTTAALLIYRARGQIVEATARPRASLALAGEPFQMTLTPRGVADPGASEAPDSTLLAVWREGSAGDEGVGPDAGPARAALRLPGAGFSPDQVVSEPQVCDGRATNDVLDTSGAVTTGREALVTWRQCTGDAQSPGGNAGFARRWSPAGGWDPVVGLGQRSNYGGPVALAADGEGDLAFAFLAGDRDVAVASMQPGGALTPLEHLRSSGDARRTGARIAAAGDRQVVIWGSGKGYQAAAGRLP